MATVVLLGTLDTKGREYAFLRERLLEQGVDVLVVDAGVGEPVGLWPDVANTELAGDAAELWEAHDRGDAVTAMGEGAASVVRRLHEEGRLDGLLAIGGSGGSSIAAAAMRELPVGVPKLIVSTLGSGDTRPYVGASDVSMTYSVVDIAGVNSISARFEGRNLNVHNPTVTLTRTTPDECRELGRRIGRKLSAAKGPTALFVPLRGVSIIAVEGQPFYDAEADQALLDGLQETLAAHVE